MRTAFTILLASVCLSIHAQNLHYDIVRNNSPIGTLDITEQWDGAIQTFSITNIVEFKVLFTFKVVYTLTESFDRGALISGEGYNTLNDITQKETSITRKPDGTYQLLIDGVEAMGEKTSIFESMAKVYHEEPLEQKKYYSQYFGRYLTFEEIGNHQYRLKSPDGENIYKYEYGYCTEVKVVRDFATFYIKMNPETLATIKKSDSKKD